MSIPFVRLPYTLWYDGKDKTFRINLKGFITDDYYKDGKKYISKIRKVQVVNLNAVGDVIPPENDGTPRDVSEVTKVTYNEEKYYTDITLKSYPEYNNDGELILSISFEVYNGFEEYISDYAYRQKDVDIVIPVRSHDNPANLPQEMYSNGIKTTDITIRNVESSPDDASVDFVFELIEYDATDDFITNGIARQLVKYDSVTNVHMNADPSGLNVSVNYNKRANISWDDLKQYLGSSSNSNEYVTTTLEDILSMLRNTDDSIRNEFTSDIIEYMHTYVKVNENKDIIVEYTPNYTNTQGELINNKRELFTIPRSLLDIPNKETIKNEVVESIKPTLDTTYYSKQEVDTLIDNLRKELKPDS